MKNKTLDKLEKELSQEFETQLEMCDKIPKDIKSIVKAVSNFSISSVLLRYKIKEL